MTDPTPPPNYRAWHRCNSLDEAVELVRAASLLGLSFRLEDRASVADMDPHREETMLEVEYRVHITDAIPYDDGSE